MSISKNPKVGSINTTALLIVMLSGAFIATLNQTVISPALPSIMRDLGITASDGQWLTTAFMLVNGIMVPITAYLINKFTTRQLFVAAMLFFSGGTTLAAFATTFPLLLGGRIFQAMGAGILMPLIQTVTLLIFPKDKRGSAMGMIGIVMAFAPAVGPTLAGWIVDVWGWNAIFSIIAPLGFIDIIFAFIFLKNVGETSNPTLDMLSVVFSTLGFGGLLYGFSVAGNIGWTNPETLLTLLVGIVFLVLFIRRQGKLEEPLLQLKVFTVPIFTYSTILGMIVNAALIAGGIIMPIYLQSVIGFKAVQTGLLMLPGAILMGVMSPITGKLFDKFGPRGLSLSGLSIMTIGTFFFVLCDETFGFYTMMAVYTFRSLGMSMVFMPITTWGMNSLDNSLIAHGGAASNTMRSIAGSIGTALLITIMTIGTNSRAEAGFVESTLFGMHAAFLCATILCVIALVIAILFVKDDAAAKERRKKRELCKDCYIE